MVLAVSFAFAQNTANVNQVGTSNNGTVEQSGGGLNLANLDQYGTNIASIDQVGNSNIADIDQGSLGNNVTNSPYNVSNNLHGSFIEQIGDDNKGYVTIKGSGSGTMMYQKGDLNYGIQNLTYSGSAGYAGIGRKMGVDLLQDGASNRSIQTTVRSFGSSTIREMYVKQIGNSNNVNQLSIGGSGNNQHVFQNGNGNNNPTVSGNVLDVSATGLSNPLNLPWAFTNQGGYVSTNDYTQYSNQMAGVAHINVNGHGNNTYQFQETSWSNKANIGVINILLGDNNDVIQGQKGDLNNSNIEINGDGNIVTSSQFGDSNIVDIDLVLGSDNNVVGVQQTGDEHSAKVFQNGDSNFAKVQQSY